MQPPSPHCAGLAASWLLLISALQPKVVGLIRLFVPSLFLIFFFCDMFISTNYSAQSSLARLLLVFLMALGLSVPALAAPPPPPTSRSLTEALNPDGTLKTGVIGSFDARQFRMGTAPDGRPVFRPTGTTGAGDEFWQSGFGLPNGVDGVVYAVVRSGTDMYIGGSFTAVGNLIANGVAKWNGAVWSSLGTGPANGMIGPVYALAVASTGDVYAGGNFATAGGMTANNVARWTGTAWSPLTGAANGVSGGYVNALVVAGTGDVYAGGTFTMAGGVTANNVAKWTGTTWSSLGTGPANGVNGAVYTLAVAGSGDVYAGGSFRQAGGAAAPYVARWSGTAWNSLGMGTANGMSGPVNALAVAGNGDVYAGGFFMMAGGVAASRVARWNGTAWNPLGTGAANGVSGVVLVLAVAGNGDVYAGGFFTQAGAVGANNVARWNGTAWSSLGAGLSSGGSSYVYALTVASTGDVSVGGSFTQAGAVGANNVAQWTGTVWNALGTGLANGLNGGINALVIASNGSVYAGGDFTQAGAIVANGVVRWTGTMWAPLGIGSANGVNGSVTALALASNGDVYAGGNFTTAGGVVANYVARWNGTAWNALGTGLSSGAGSGAIYALVVASNGDVYAGGDFATAGGAGTNNVARWNGSTWSSVGTGAANGVSGSVYALAVASNGDIYAGGGFATAGGVAVNGVARWSGTAWSPLSSATAIGVNGYVSALALAANGNLYVGGSFTTAGGIAASGVAKWDGTAWSSLGTGGGNGVNGGSVYELALAGNGDVYAGGLFTRAGGGVMPCVARWNGTAWSSLGTGLQNSVSALVLDPTGKLYAGGSFVTTGDGSKAMTRFAVYDPNTPLAMAATLPATLVALFPNPAHGTATLRLPASVPRQQSLILTDALGRPVRYYPAPASPDIELDLRGLPAGVYLLRCGLLTQRLVVE